MEKNSDISLGAFRNISNAKYIELVNSCFFVDGYTHFDSNVRHALVILFFVPKAEARKIDIDTKKSHKALLREKNTDIIGPKQCLRRYRLLETVQRR